MEIHAAKIKNRLKTDLLAKTIITLVWLMFAIVVIQMTVWPRPVLAGSQTDSSLTVALVHFGCKFKDPKDNLNRLIELNRKAAEGGADVIFNTEMAVTGYSFRSRKDIAPFTETERGRTIQAMKKLAKKYGVYIGITFPERDDATKIFYNSAFVLDPDGKLVCKYRKIQSEKRWARPGSAFQDGTFDTPWGRMGTLICADSHDSLMARVMALKGVNLLWVPANWPPVTGIVPGVIWCARALENGIFVAACNRTGKDRISDFSESASYVYDPMGKRLFSGKSATSQVFFVKIPLNAEGRLDDTQRLGILTKRKVDHYRQIYLEPWVMNITKFYKLPKPGLLDLHCVIPASDHLTLGELEARIQNAPKREQPSLWILPEMSVQDVRPEALAEIARKYDIAFALSRKESDGRLSPLLITPKGIENALTKDDNLGESFPFKLLPYGPATLAIVDQEAFSHPELAVILSKMGCDLVVLSEGRMSPERMLMSRVKSIGGLAVCACARNGAQITCMKDLHGTCDQRELFLPGVCFYELDTKNTRKKRFQNRIDFDLLLSTEAKKS